MRALAAALTCVGLLAAPRPAGAAVERFAVLIGNNAGARDEMTLRFAEKDAVKVRDVLVDLGGFRAENVVLLEGQSADEARRAIITVNDRIRTLAAGSEAVLLVYYSGHGDAEALHLGDSALALDELERLVRGSAATVRLLVVDACRSGSLTRVKGGTVTGGFRISVDERLAAQGAVFLTSSAANEDAQESDDLGGSFFTHYFVSGLLGAADENGDGHVSLAEAYGYAYAHTLRASSRTLAGMQHPTFRYNLSGRGEVILTSLAGARGRRGWLTLPEGRAYLILRGGPDGAVIAEVGARDVRRRLSVKPGRYFVRARGRVYLLEGSVTVESGKERTVVDGELTRTSYARLVRKGGGLDRVHGPQIGWRVRPALGGDSLACVGSLVGYLLELPELDMGARLGACNSRSDDDSLTNEQNEIDLEVRVGKTFDVGGLSLSPVASVGGGFFRRRLEMEEIETDTDSFAHMGAGLSVGWDLSGPSYIAIEAEWNAYFFREPGQDLSAPGQGLHLTVALGWRLFH